MAIATPGPSHQPYGIITAGQDTVCTTAPAALPATATKTIFTVNGTGGVYVKAIWGVVTTVIQTQTCNLKISAAVTGLTAVDICANGAISALAVGTLLLPNTTFATALSVASTNGVIIAVPITAPPTAFIMAGPGTITITTSATNTGAIQWYCMYSPILNANPVNVSVNFPTSELVGCNA